MLTNLPPATTIALPIFRQVNMTLVAISGSGNFTIKREDGHTQTCERLGVDADDEFYIKEYKNAKLLDGKALEISGTLRVQLNPKD